MLNVTSCSRELRGQHANLAGDFASRQVADQPHLAGQAERARHRAADLRRDAERHRRRVGDEHRLDVPAVGEPEQELLGAVDRRFASARRPGVVSAKSSASEARRLRGRSVMASRSVTPLPVDPAEDLTRAEPLVSALDERRLDCGAFQIRQVQSVCHAIMCILACNSFTLNRLQTFAGWRDPAGHRVELTNRQRRSR